MLTEVQHPGAKNVVVSDCSSPGRTSSKPMTEEMSECQQWLCVLIKDEGVISTFKIKF